MASSKRSAEKKAYWRSLIDEQRRSGETIRRFCEQRGVSEPSFFSWRKKIVTCESDEELGALLPVNVLVPSSDKDNQLPPSNGQMFELIVPGGFVLRFDESAQPQAVSKLLGVIVGYTKEDGTC